ncbi:MAG: hypothetical protein A3H31_00260 [Gallionellales bacterium RIFCSPLOWO2_02_FULL_57_47]|nr:MAG: hypothetical protein A3H31_00260 [Gallionellales bacterium RIFCSPLOWO2_02_FULL_57_47]OGT15052.1 MAG: hypothetical protein A3J49_06770 [Gallionellales bacterium RIFCSPHIGHO2_02_FULL_57_16]
MATIDDVLNSLKDDAVKLVKDQLKDLLTSAKKDADSVVKETGQKITDWLVMRAHGKLSDDELEALLYSRDQLLRQYKNTLEIQTRARVEKIAVGLINLVLDKILGFAFG